MKDANYWIEKLELQPHLEGAYFKETYRSEENVVNKNGKTRSAATGIYFLITSDNFSAFHKIESDEMWHFHGGSPLSVYVILPDGELEILYIGNDLEKGETPQAIVSAGCWFASKVEVSNSYSFVGCTVSPGFDFQDFVLANREELTAEYPTHSDLIKELTRL
jgi:predicted cupin superfamily sugar epimerase